MNAYMFQAALYCEKCGEKIRDSLTALGKAPADPEDECSYDSDDFPKGPFSDGGGEADSPQHCDCGEECLDAITLPDGRKVGAWLENDLTSEGQEYVEEACKRDLAAGRNDSVALNVWAEGYQVSLKPDDEDDEDDDD